MLARAGLDAASLLVRAFRAACAADEKSLRVRCFLPNRLAKNGAVSRRESSRIPPVFGPFA
jgi:hypothetical protein